MSAFRRWPVNRKLLALTRVESDRTLSMCLFLLAAQRIGNPTACAEACCADSKPPAEKQVLCQYTDPMHPSDTALHEPLQESAPLMWRQAQQSCGPQCRSYHGVWQYLRMLGVITSIRGDGAYFIDAVRRLAREGELKRVLISGAADYGTLAHVLAGCRPNGWRCCTRPMRRRLPIPNCRRRPSGCSCRWRR